MRTLEDLVDTADPGLVVVQEWIRSAENAVEVLPCDSGAGERALCALQVSTRSPMGAIAHGTGGLLVDDGWVRVLGAGASRLERSISDWNGTAEGRPTRAPGALLVGDDAVGGFFALSGGGIEVPPRCVGYYAPDTLEWEDMGMGYSAWLQWLFSGDLECFYEGTRWPGWREEAALLSGDQAVHVYPWLFAEGPPIAERARKVVPVAELWALYVEELPRQLGPRSGEA